MLMCKIVNTTGNGLDIRDLEGGKFKEDKKGGRKQTTDGRTAETVRHVVKNRQKQRRH